MNSVRIAVLVALLGFSAATKTIELEGRFQHRRSNSSHHNSMTFTRQNLANKLRDRLGLVQSTPLSKFIFLYRRERRGISR